jgi:hypothetical protein
MASPNAKATFKVVDDGEFELVLLGYLVADSEEQLVRVLRVRLYHELFDLPVLEAGRLDEPDIRRDRSGSAFG